VQKTAMLSYTLFKTQELKKY